MIALGADHIVAHSGTITGSIGVIMQLADISGLLERIGVNADAVRSGPLKGRPSPLEPMNPEVRAATQAVVDDMYNLFVDMVVERRGLPREQVLALADGRIFTGRQAVAALLIDGLGGEAEARRWLSSRGVDGSLPIRDLKIERGFESWFETGARALGKTLFSERLTLDGLVSVWHPQLR
jgi:protease-4